MAHFVALEDRMPAFFKFKGSSCDMKWLSVTAEAQQPSFTPVNLMQISVYLIKRALSESMPLRRISSVLVLFLDSLLIAPTRAQSYQQVYVSEKFVMKLYQV